MRRIIPAILVCLVGAIFLGGCDFIISDLRGLVINTADGTPVDGALVKLELRDDYSGYGDEDPLYSVTVNGYFVIDTDIIIQEPVYELTIVKQGCFPIYDREWRPSGGKEIFFTVCN
jgi:hypothetical protein